MHNSIAVRWAGALVMLGACASSPPPPVVAMDPVVVQATPDPLTGLDSYDAAELLELGNQEYGAGNYDRSVKIFEMLVETFPESDLVVSAAYNAALSYEKLEEWPDAARWFQWVVERDGSSETGKHAHFAMGFALAKSDRWEDSTDTYWAIRQRDDLDVMEELEARTNTAVGFFMQTDYTTAEVEFMRALSFYEDQGEENFLPARYFVGQSRFYLGEIYARWFEQKQIRLPEPGEDGEAWVDAAGTDLEDKCKLLLRAQNHFIRSIREGHTGWATAAGYRIGSLYETLHTQMMEVPVPEDLTESAQEVYVEELRKKVSVLVVKAIRVYEMSLEMAERVGERNEWVERTNASLERMKALYETQLLDS